MKTRSFHKKMLSVAICTLFCTILFSSCGKNERDSAFNITPPHSSDVVTKVSLSPEQKEFVSNGNQFAFHLLENMFDGKSLFISPLSVQFSLGMVLNGANGETASQITNALGYGSNGADEVNLFCKTLLEQVPFVDKRVTLSIINAALANIDYPFNKVFSNAINGCYYAPVVNISSEDDFTLEKLNDWASRNTDGKISPFVSKIPAQGTALIASALYFKAPWKTKDNRKPLFNAAETFKKAFYSVDSEKKMEFMTTKALLDYGNKGQYSILSIPLSDSKYSVYFFLPKEKTADALYSMVGSIAGETWKDLYYSLGTKYVVAQIPKFKIDGQYILNKPLGDMGIKDAFALSEADFSAMFDTPEKTRLGLESIIQTASIEINEWGTTAMATTTSSFDEAIESGDESDPIIFLADHPFVFMIAENLSGVVLFEGVFTGE